MLQKKRIHPAEKIKMHPRNRHRERYVFSEIIDTCPELAQFVELNKYNDESIDFFNPEAVLVLNKALLKHYYGIDNWSIPKGYLCPPIPGRADYIHHIAELLSDTNYSIQKKNFSKDSRIKCLDIGIGANCVYPIIGVKEYGWSFIGSDIDPVSIKSSDEIIKTNSILKDKVELRLQHNVKDVFNGILQKDELIDLTICNPPFHASLAEAQSVAVRKLRNLKQKKINKPNLNFGGKNNELWCEGGEERFILNMIRESEQFSASCFWFSTLISKQSNIKATLKALSKAKAIEVKRDRFLPVKDTSDLFLVSSDCYFADDSGRASVESRTAPIPKVSQHV